MDDQKDTKRLYEAIFHRKSVRKFESAPLDESTMNAVMHKVESLSALNGERAVFRVLGPDQVKGIVSAKSPHFLAVYAEKSETARVNAGFMAQQMDLWLSANGLGCCWLGMPRTVTEASEASGLPFAIVLAFGKPQEDVHRADSSAFKRKPMGEITDLAGMDALIEPVRLAPSATNRQPWYLSGDARAVRLYGKQNGALARKMFGDMPHFDMGIALCHLWLAAEATGRFDALERESSHANVPHGYDYVWTVRLMEGA